ncbi:hypothetical protein Gpo141_00007282 [Globisporangium polare]
MVSWRVNTVRDFGFVMDRVAILTTEKEDPEAPWCMGLLVAPDALLTYAHCVSDVSKQGQSISWAFFGSTMESFHEAQSQQQQQNDDDGPEATDPNRMKRQSGSGPQAGSGSRSSTSTSTSMANETSSTTATGSATLVTGTNGTTTANNNSTRSSRRRLRSEEVEVGDVANWVQVIDVIFHPEYDRSSSSNNSNTSSSAATDMAIVRLAVPRDIEPFQLLPDEATVVNSTNVQMTNPLEAYRVSNSFITNKNAPKTQSIGPFRKVNWFFCALSSSSSIAERKRAASSQMCVVPEAVRERVPLSTINSFVMVGDQLAGLSVCHSKNCKNSVVHPYVLVSAVKDFIELATRKQDVWTDMGLFTIGGSDTILQGYLSGLRKTKSAANFCLGSLIGSQFVLTAAHCVKDVAFSFVSVGSKYSSSEDDGEQIKVKSVTIHPEFNPKTLLNDFALVELQYMSIQKPLVLDNESDQQLYASTSTLTLYGYAGGGGSGDAKQSTDKQPVQSLALPLVKNSVCNSLIGDSSLDATIVCAGGEKGKDGCQGDSGAPLVQESSDGGDPYLVALSSFGWGCGLKGVPAVYAKVSAAKSFIEKNAQGHTWRYKTDQGSTGSGGTTTTPSSSTGTTTDNGATQNSSSPATMSPSEEERSGEGATSGDQQVTQPAAAGGTTTQQENEDEIIESMCREENWTCASTISLLGALQSIVIPTTTSQFTRDTVATILLSSKEHVPHEEIRVTSSSDSGSSSSSRPSSDSDSNDASSDANLTPTVTTTRYSCNGPIQMYSSGDLSGIETKLAEFEDRPLRKRKARFPRAPGQVRLPVS